MPGERLTSPLHRVDVVPAFLMEHVHQHRATQHVAYLIAAGHPSLFDRRGGDRDQIVDHLIGRLGEHHPDLVPAAEAALEAVVSFRDWLQATAMEAPAGVGVTVLGSCYVVVQNFRSEAAEVGLGGDEGGTVSLAPGGLTIIERPF